MGVNTCIVYIDDFYITAETYDSCKVAMDLLINLLLKLGFTINHKKVIQPCQELAFLGVTINTITGKLSIPEQKLTAAIDELKMWMDKRMATKRELQSLLGKLSWIAKIIKAIRPLLRNLINLCCKLKIQSHRITIPKYTNENLCCVKAFAAEFNGTTYFILDNCLPVYKLVTDACPEGGFSSVW